MVPSVTLEGTLRDMGEQHGEILRTSIRALAELRMEYLMRTVESTDAQAIEEIAVAMGQQIEKQLPEVFEETAATARAAGIPYWKLVVAGAVSDVSDVAGRGNVRGAAVLSECTILVARTEAQGVVIAGTWDSHATATEHLAICERRPNGLPATTALTTAGWPMQQAVNSAGIGLVVANVVGANVANGVPFIAVLPEIARAQTLAEAGPTVARVPHASGRFYVIGDASAARGFEVVPTVGIFEDDHVPMVHTNHYLFEDARPHEGRPQALESSELRLAIAGRLADESREVTAVELVKALAHSGVCQDGDGDGDRTGAIFAIVPKDGSIIFATSTHEDVTELKLRLEK